MVTTPALSLPAVLAKLAALKPPVCAFCLIDVYTGLDSTGRPVPKSFTPRRGVTVAFGSVCCTEHVADAWLADSASGAAAAGVNGSGVHHPRIEAT